MKSPRAIPNYCKTWMAGTSPAMTAEIRDVFYAFAVRGGFFANATAIAEINGFMK
jgi:hypothetical protein